MSLILELERIAQEQGADLESCLQGLVSLALKQNKGKIKSQPVSVRNALILQIGSMPNYKVKSTGQFLVGWKERGKLLNRFKNCEAHKKVLDDLIESGEVLQYSGIYKNESKQGRPTYSVTLLSLPCFDGHSVEAVRRTLLPDTELSEFVLKTGFEQISEKYEAAFGEYYKPDDFRQIITKEWEDEEVFSNLIKLQKGEK